MHVVLALLIGVLPLWLRAEEEQAGRSRADNLKTVRETHRRRLAEYGGAADKLVRTGLLADRAARRVELQAESTGVVKGEPVEFLLIGPRSGHDYESLAVSFASPRDVHEALCFVGLTAGRPVDFRTLRFWPKGERVKMTFRTGEPPLAEPVRVETLIWDERSGAPMPAHGLVFVGSRKVRPADGTNEVYAAEVREPHAIASNYNEPDTVLDVPVQAPQNDVYRQQSVNPAYVLPAGRMLTVVLEPEYGPERRRVCELTLTALPTAGTNVVGLAGLRCRLAEREGEVLIEKGPLEAAISRFRAIVGDGRDPFVELRLADALPLGAVRDLCRVLSSVEGPTGIRMEPPPDGQLYYRAFVPNERFRDRSARLAQPWELRLRRAAQGGSGTLTRIDEVWEEDEPKPRLEARDFPVRDGAQLREVLDAEGPGLKVILVFAPSELKHGELMAFLKPALRTHGTVHVYLD